MSPQQHNEEEQDDFSFKKLFSPLTTLKAIHIIVIVGFIVFGNSLFNGFVADDKGQFVASDLTHSLNNVPLIFHSILQTPGDNSITFFYRPITFTIITIINFFFGLSPFYFHFIQLIIHIINSILVYFLFKKHIRNQVAFFISLLFLIHPVNSETVSYISNLQDTLFMFFGLVAIQVSISRLTPLKKTLLLGVTLLASILSKETGGLFFIMIPLYNFLFTQKQRLSVLLSTSVSFIVYLFLRFFSEPLVAFDVSKSAISMMSFEQRLLSMPKIIFHYLQIFMFPKNLALGWNWTVENVNFVNFYLPLFFDSLFFTALISILYYLHKKKSKLVMPYKFFFIWFLLGLAIHIQIIPLDFTVADRWMYFPMIGLLGLIGIGVDIIINTKKIATNLIVLILCILIIVFGIRTIVRNSNFYDDITLFSHDLKVIPNNPILENTLGVAYLFNGNLNEAKVHLERSVHLDEHSQGWNNLGLVYAKLGDLNKARQYLQKSTELSDYGEYKLAYINLAKIELLSNNLKEAKQTAEHGLKKFPNEPTFWLLLAAAEHKLGNKSAMLTNSQKAKSLDKNINLTDFIEELNKY